MARNPNEFNMESEFQGRREKLVSGGGAGRNIWRPFSRTQTNLQNSRPKFRNNFDLFFFFFSNFSHFFHTPPTTAPRTLHSPLCTPGVGPPSPTGVGPHTTFPGGLQPPTAPPVYAPGEFGCCSECGPA
jgi:hypothetical protein